MPTVRTGARPTAGSSTTQILQAQRVVEMHDTIMLLEPSKTPLTTFSSMVSRKSVQNPDFSVIEDELIPNIDRINQTAGHTSGDTTITVDNAAYVPPNSLIRVQRTGEVMRVTSVNTSTNVLTVSRSFGATAAAALLDNDQITMIGGAAAEGATAEASKTTLKTTGINYCQIFRWPFEVTNTERESELYGGADLPYQSKKAGIEFGKSVEKAFFFGESAVNTSGATAIRATGGIDTFVSTNDQDMGGTFNLVSFFSAAETFFRYGQKKKMLFASRGLCTNISLEAVGFVQTTRSDKTLGVKITRLETPHGDLNIIAHDLLEGDKYGGYGYVVDMNNVGYRFLRNRDVKLKTNIQANDSDTRKDEYLGEVGFWRSLEKTHGRFTNAA